MIDELCTFDTVVLCETWLVKVYRLGFERGSILQHNGLAQHPLVS